MNERMILRCDFRMEAPERAEILVYGAIVPSKWDKDDPEVTAKEFDGMLREAKKSGAKSLRLRINSGGGSVFQAVAMRSMLEAARGSFAEMSVMVEGLCASAATLLLLPGVPSGMAAGSMLMVHNPSSIVWGSASDMEREAAVLRKMEQEFTAMYVELTGQSEETVRAWMDEETWFTAEEARDAGFVDEITDEGEAAACVPEEVMAAMREAYRHTPELKTAHAAAQTVSHEEPTGTAGESSEIPNREEEQEAMEIRDITAEQLRAENPDLARALMREGAEEERRRIGDIDDLTPAGFEAMAEEAKKAGTSAADFLRAVVKAQRDRGPQFLQTRAKETEPAAAVAGGDAKDNDASDEAELKAYAESMKKYTAGAEPHAGGMF